MRHALRLFTLLLVLTPSDAFAWGPIHSSITEAAVDVLPSWQRELLAPERDALISFYCMIPDLAQAPVHKKTLGSFVILPNGDLFSHLPFKTRDKNAYQIKYYVDRTIEMLRANDLKNAAHWAGCLLHFLEDSGSPAHTMPGDNMMGLMKDLLPTPEAFRNIPLHSTIEEGKLPVDLAGYKPQLLGTTSDEAVMHLIERYNAMVRNARAQVIPILEATYRGSQPDVDAARLRAAATDARVVADALYTILCIAKNRFDPADTAHLEVVDVSALTPNEVIHQSYFPQHSFFSDPYFGFPVRNAIIDKDKRAQPLALTVTRDGATTDQTFDHGLGLGTGCRVTYVLPDKVYDRFDCLVGLHATLGKQGKLVFKIYADGEAVVDTGIITADTPARPISLAVWNIREITIATENKNASPGHNYAVIAEPTLSKAKDPKKLDQKKVE